MVPGSSGARMRGGCFLEWGQRRGASSIHSFYTFILYIHFQEGPVLASGLGDAVDVLFCVGSHRFDFGAAHRAIDAVFFGVELEDAFNTIYAEGVAAIEGDRLVLFEVVIADRALLFFARSLGFEMDEDGDLGDVHFDVVIGDKFFEEAVELEGRDGGAESVDDGVDFAGLLVGGFVHEGFKSLSLDVVVFIGGVDVLEMAH